MQAYSFTAPRFTEEDDRKERALLSPEELDDIQKDIYGGHPPKNEIPLSEADQRRAVKHLEEALDLIPIHDKKEYLEALRIAPDLVRTESDAICFMKFAEMNAWSAAERVVKYWKFRKKIFGDTAFRPLTITGQGALTEADIQCLETGFFMILPDDDKGRCVMSHDRGVIDYYASGHSRASVLRVLFYMFSVASRRPSVQTNGIILIANTKSLPLSRFDRSYARSFSHLVNECLPIQIKAVHIITTGFKSVMDLIAPMIYFLAGKYLRRRICVHGGSDREILMDLSGYGIVQENVPALLGGGWTMERFRQWIDRQLQLELGAASAAPTEDEDTVMLSD